MSHYVYGLNAKILSVSVPKNNFYQLDQYMNTSHICNTGFLLFNTQLLVVKVFNNHLKSIIKFHKLKFNNGLYTSVIKSISHTKLV